MIIRVRAWIGRRLRRLADRLDVHGAPRHTGMSFTIEHKRGWVLREDGRGCPLWYLGEDDYELAHTQADTEHIRVDWVAGRSSWVGGRE